MVFIDKCKTLGVPKLLQVSCFFNLKVKLPSAKLAKTLDVSARTEIKKPHVNLNPEAVGVTLRADEPHLAAPPDGLCSCGCAECQVSLQKSMEGLEG